MKADDRSMSAAQPLLRAAWQLALLGSAGA